MSHFFTKDKQLQLSLLKSHINLEELATATVGQVLKAVADVDGNIMFQPGVDDGGLPAGNEGELLRVVSGTAQFVDISGELLPAPSTEGHVLTVIATPDPDDATAPDILSWQSSALPSAPTSLDDLIDPTGLEDNTVAFVTAGSWSTGLLPASSELPSNPTEGDMIVYSMSDSAWNVVRPNVLHGLSENTPYKVPGDVLTAQNAQNVTLGVAQSNDPAGMPLFGLGFSDIADWQSHSKDVYVRFRINESATFGFTVADQVDRTIITIEASFDGTQTVGLLKTAFEADGAVPSGFGVIETDVATLDQTIDASDIGGEDGSRWLQEVGQNNIIYAFGSTVWGAEQPESLPEGGSDGDTLIWKGLNRTSSFDFVGSISIGGISIGWVDESQWLAQNKPISLTFVMDPLGMGAGSSGSSVVHNTGDQLDWSITANWNQGAGGIGANEIENVIRTAIADDPNLNNYIQVMGSDDSISSADIGLPEIMGSITAGPSAPFILSGRAYWESRPSADTTASNMLTDINGILMIDEHELSDGITYELNFVANEVVVVLNDWAEDAANPGVADDPKTVTLCLRAGETGQHVFIKNLSALESYAADGSASRVIKIKAGDAAVDGSGQIDLVRGEPGFEIDSMVDMHLVCINGDGGASGDGEWIIL